MSTSLILTICAHDRPGIMSNLSSTVSEHGGNWLQSRMARLAGQFAGIARVEIAKEDIPAFETAMQSLQRDGISIQIHPEGDISDQPFTRCMKVDIFGNDRRGIVSQLTQAIAQTGANIEELNTSIESAPMSGHPIFHASGIVCLPDQLEDETFITAIENLSDDLNVEISQH